MNRPVAARERSIATFLLAILALNPPVLTLFSADIFLFGVPLLYLYLFAVWLIIVAMVARHATADGRGGGIGRERDRRRSGHAR